MTKLYTKLSTRTSTRLSVENILYAFFKGFLVLSGIMGVMEVSVTSISGTINDYAAVIGIDEQSVTVDDASDFDVGDKILIIQMKGAQIDETDDEGYGDILSYENAGNYEFNTIASVSGNEITLDFPVGNRYTVSEFVQVVRVPVYDDVKVSGTLTADPWDGTKGGILAIEATGTLQVKADFDASDAGFRGGDLNGRATKGGLTYICEFNSGQGGIKGEGMVAAENAACRGKLANGGGGGNDHNGGGGGGGNYGAGGIGGDGWYSNAPGLLSDKDKGGRGGASLNELYDVGTPKLFLGGGGGGGHQNNGASLPAANGAGIIIVIANKLKVSNTASFLAGALDATDLYTNDGAGGGGAGGAILLDVKEYQNSWKLTLDVSGGDGGSVHTADQHGPGGGGAGGYINSTDELPNDIIIKKDGGDAGLFVSSNRRHIYHNTTHGASAGEIGAVIENLVIQNATFPPALDLDATTSGVDYETNYTLSHEPVAIGSFGNVMVDDSDNDNMYSAEIELINPLDGDQEYLQLGYDHAALATFGIVAVVSEDKHFITLVGAAPRSTYQNIISKITYGNDLTDADLSDRYIQARVNDGGSVSNDAQTTVHMQEIYLPVEWGNVEVQWQGDKGKLDWSTSRELNSDHFVVEQSLKGTTFKDVGKVAAAGNSTETQNYTFTDEQIPTNWNQSVFYRIRQIDLNGSQSYSQVLELKPNQRLGEISLNIFPNPAMDIVTVTSDLTGETRATLFIRNITGQLIQQKELKAVDGRVQVEMAVLDWAPGAYFVQVISEYETLTKKLIVK